MAFFEAGIKLGAAFHQFLGTPVNTKNAEIIEKAIRSCILLQPYVQNAEVKIDRNKLLNKASSFGYTVLSEDMLKITVTVKVGKVKVIAKLEWDDEKKYPLMKAKLGN